MRSIVELLGQIKSVSAIAPAHGMAHIGNFSSELIISVSDASKCRPVKARDRRTLKIVSVIGVYPVPCFLATAD